MIDNNKLLEQIFRHRHSCHVLLDRDFNFVRVNEAYANTYGKPVDFFPGKSYFVERYPNAEDIFKEVLASKSSSRITAFPVVKVGLCDINTSYWDCEVDPVFDQKGGVETLLLTEFDVTEKVRAEWSFEKSKKLLTAISNAHQHYSQNVDPRVFLDVLMSDVIDLTDSEYGFLGEVLHKDDGKPYMKMISVPNLAWTQKTRSFFDTSTPPNQEFTNMNTLFGVAIQTGEVVIANDPAGDPRSGGLPEGHPPVNSFLCIPFCADEDLVVIIGVANRAGGYSQSLVEFLQPLMSAYNHLFNTYVIDTEKRDALTSLNQSKQKIHRLTLPLIEYEHQELVELINECYEQIASNTDVGTIEILLNQIYAGIAEHFSSEKELMENSTYPDREEHLESHEKLLTVLRDLIDHFVEKPDEGVIVLQTTLAEWFGRHVSTLDQTLHKYFSNQSPVDQF